MKNLSQQTQILDHDDRDARNRARGEQLCKQLLRNQDPTDAFASLATAMAELSQCDDYSAWDQEAKLARENALRQLDELKEILSGGTVALERVH